MNLISYHYRLVLNVTQSWKKSKNITAELVGVASVMIVQPIRDQYQKEAGLHL